MVVDVLTIHFDYDVAATKSEDEVTVVAVSSMCLGHLVSSSKVTPPITMVGVNALQGGARVLVEAVASLPQ